LSYVINPKIHLKVLKEYTIQQILMVDSPFAEWYITDIPFRKC